MPQSHSAMSMDQKIFSMNFSVETTSVYLLCCGLADKKAPLTMENLSAAWPGSEASLKKGLEDLKNRGVIIYDESQDPPFSYQLNPPMRWIPE